MGSIMTRRQVRPGEGGGIGLYRRYSWPRNKLVKVCHRRCKA